VTKIPASVVAEDQQVPSLAHVTVIVPTRNEAHNISSFLASLPDELALIVVDDSTDATPAIVRRERPHRTRLIRRTSGLIGCGVIAKTAHTLARCALLRTGLMPRRWRSHAWGYWSERSPYGSGQKKAGRASAPG
jgi:hypothetical protein